MTLYALKLFIYIRITQAGQGIFILLPKLRSENGERLKELLQQIATEIQVEILEMAVVEDHVHLLIEVDPQFGVHKAIKRFKGARSELPTVRVSTP